MSTKYLSTALIVGNDGLALDWSPSDFNSPQDESLNTQDDAQVVNPILASIVRTEIRVCPYVQWMFYHSSFEQHDLEPKQMYIYNDFPCMFYMKDRDTSNADSYGSCEIDYTGKLNLIFTNGDTTTFNWVIRYNDIPAYVDTRYAITRFKHISFNGENSYLWSFCNRSAEDEHINALEAVIGSCENTDWRFYTEQFYAMGIDPLPVYLYDEKSSCEVHLGR